MGRSSCTNKQYDDAAFPNDTKGDSDGPTWIQTATGGDNPRTAGGTPTTDLFTNIDTNRACEGGSNKHEEHPT